MEEREDSRERDWEGRRWRSFLERKEWAAAAAVAVRVMISVRFWRRRGWWWPLVFWVVGFLVLGVVVMEVDLPVEFLGPPPPPAAMVVL